MIGQPTAGGGVMGEIMGGTMGGTMRSLVPGAGNPIRRTLAGVALGGATLIRVGIALALLPALAAEALLTPTVASAADTWTVQVGATTPTGESANAFFPDPITIHIRNK